MVNLEERRDKCLEEVKINCSDLLDERGRIDTLRLKIKKDSPREILEYFFWKELSGEQYWRAFSKLEFLFEQENGSIFSEEDLGEISELMKKQILEGKEICTSVPMYSDIFNLIGKKENPLEKYVSKSEIADVLNEGFWSCLNGCADKGDKKWDFVRELDKIIGYENFFDYFNFEKGIEKAVEIREDINLTEFQNLWNYLRWFLIQKDGIYRGFKKNVASETVGKLAAPFVERLLNKIGSNENDDESLKLVRLIIDKDMVKSRAVQNVLGGFFESELRLGLEGSYDFDSRIFSLSEGNLMEVGRHSDKVWGEVKDSIDLINLSPELKKYVPRKAYETYVADLRENVESMKRFDLTNFGEWMRLSEAEVSKSVKGKVRNKALEVYFEQKMRPSRDDLIGLSHFSNCLGSGIEDKFSGVMVSDWLVKKEWGLANNILIKYNLDATPKQKKVFLESVSDYVERHGKININERGRDKKTCYPVYNLIPDFAENFSELFI